jgi:hypothetical protein
MSGLDSEQLDELEERVAALLDNPWDSGTGRPRELTLREAIIVSSGYARQNIIEDVWAEIFDTSQPTISRIITEITPCREGYCGVPPRSRARQDRRPRSDRPGGRLPGAVLVLARITGPLASWRAS